MGTCLLMLQKVPTCLQVIVAENCPRQDTNSKTVFVFGQNFFIKVGMLILGEKVWCSSREALGHLARTRVPLQRDGQGRHIILQLKPSFCY